MEIPNPILGPVYTFIDIFINRNCFAFVSFTAESTESRVFKHDHFGRHFKKFLFEKARTLKAQTDFKNIYL